MQDYQEQIKRRARRPEYAATLQKAREDLVYLTGFADSPERVSGYAHFFCCPDCAAQLVFDAHAPYTEGAEYRCAKCGGTARGKQYDEAWVYYHRQDMAERLSSLSLLALLGEEGALSCLSRIVDFYADHYEEFPIHGKHAGRGKIMYQSLDEAVFAIALLEAIYPVKALLSDETLSRWAEHLFFPLCRFLLEQPYFRCLHNIMLWMCAAVGMAAVVFDNEVLLREALDGPFALREQVEQGYTADGLWHEGSFHYHYYATEALTHFLQMYRHRAPTDPLFAKLEKCYRLPSECAYDGMSVPALNDGWYPMSLADYAPQLVLAAAIAPCGAAAEQLARLSRTAPECVYTAPALLYGAVTEEDAPQGELPALSVYDATGLAVFRGDLFAILRCGVVSPQHMHEDYLSLILPPFSEDLGTPGYGHPLVNGFYRRSISHNTVLVDGRSQPHAHLPSRLLREEGGVTAETEAVWEGISARRHVAPLADGALSDSFLLTADKTHTYDWVFHVDGELLDPPEGEPTALPEREDGYALLEAVTHIGQGERLLRFATSHGIFSVHLLGEGDLYLAKTPHNPATRLRTTILLRHRGRMAHFRAIYRREGNVS